MKADLFMLTLPDIESNLNKLAKNVGCYVCSCGNYYPIPPCGFPTEESFCYVCHEKIGGLNHKLVKREGHMRIYKDLNVLNSYGGYKDGQNWYDLGGAVMTLQEYNLKRNRYLNC